MRAIDADRLLEERRIQTYYHLPNGDIAIPIIDIEHAPTVELDKGWIPVLERLPKQQQTVLIQDFGQITIGYLNAENRWRDLTNLDDYLKGVDAWMPLPECYRGDSDG